MQIHLTPMRRDDRLRLERRGEVLIVNGEAFDFSDLPEGGTLPRAAVACPWLASEVRRTDGALQLTLILPHGADAPAETLFPTTILQAKDGVIPLPPHDANPIEETSA